MKKILLLLGIILLLFACKETSEEKIETCQSLTTVTDWSTIDFKENYTIQVPKEYVGNGWIQFFEGNWFHKASPDDKIILRSDYGTTYTGKSDFGIALSDSIPAMDQIRTKNGELLLLDHRESFCDNNEIVGYLYYSQWQVCNGQLYWKVNDKFKAALIVEFPSTELGTIKKIISTIKIKQDEI